ncbi:MAG: UDP-N-acetylglucosamine 2-epimerase, partial [bacterium]
SFDRTMPEEINRMVTDSVSDFLFVTEPSGVKNLRTEGVPMEKIFMVGDVMIDTLIENLKRIRSGRIQHPLKNPRGDYAVLTLHRPVNVDVKKTLSEIIDALLEISRNIPILFPAHPRTVKNIKKFGFQKKFTPYQPSVSPAKGMIIMEPLGYLPFLALMSGARMALTDSGGIQEETTYLKVPCLTLRENTERPITIELGTNILTGTDKEKIVTEARKILRGKAKKGKIPALWDGKAAQRIVKMLEKNFNKK